MSRGSPVTPVRLPQELIDRIVAAYKRANLTRKEEPYTLSSFIRHAIEEKLAKMERGRSKKKKREKREREEREREERE